MSPAFRLSIGANLVLVGIIAILVWHQRPPDLSSVARSLPLVTPAQIETMHAKPNPMASETKSKSSPTKLTPGVVEELERDGISRDVLVSVLLEQLNRRSARQLIELQKKYAPRLVPDREMRELSRASVAEQVRELKGVFGEEGYLAWDKEQILHNLNRARVPGDELPMTAAESEQAYRLQKEFDDKNQELQLAAEDGVADRADAAMLQAQAQQTLDQGLEKLLGRQRFSELRGNIDSAAEVFRTYGDLDPTSDQAKAVVQAEGDYRAREAALVQQLNTNPGAAVKLGAELGALNASREENLRRIFASDAYDNLKRKNDPTYQTLKQYAETWELKDQDIRSVYEALRTLGDETDRTRQGAEMSEAAGQHVNWREVDATIGRARLQTEASLQTLLGSERVQRLKQNGVLPLN